MSVRSSIDGTKLRRRSAWLGAFAAILLASTGAHAAIITPPGLVVGDTYQLVFFSSTSTDATSSDIATYDAFVQAAANAAGMGSITWRVLGSTLTVAARDHAVISTPVYNMNGDLVASGFADYWDGDHVSTLQYDENNGLRAGNNNVWTGTEGDGTSGGAGNALGEATPLWGESGLLNNGAWTAHGTNVNTVLYGVYGLSEPITVIPEPGTAGLLGAALAALGARRRRARSRT